MLELSRDPEERCLEGEILKLVRQAIRRLPSKLRSAVEIRQSQDGPVSELAILAGVSLPTMKSRLMRARRKLRERLSSVLKGIPASDALHRTKERTQRGRHLDSKVVWRRPHLYAIVPLRKSCSVYLNGTITTGKTVPG